MLGGSWAILFLSRKGLRRHMIWGSVGYLLVVTVGWFFVYLLSQFTNIGDAVVPAYWSPKTLFNFGMITGGYAIEDALFSFFVGGIATVIYEIIFRKVAKLKVKHRHHLAALFLGAVLTGIFAYLFRPNQIYTLIFFGFSGAILIWIMRKDLIPHSLFGGALFTMFYFLGFFFFNLLFPHFIAEHYNLKNISGILIGSVPLEEILYALSFGMLWAPVYEYEHGVKLN